MTFSGPSAVYKLTYSYYCFRRCFRRSFSPYTARVNLAATVHINLAATTRIDLAVTCYSPPYYRPVRYQASYYGPPYCGAARS
jgi:hypothetical protein